MNVNEDKAILDIVMLYWISKGVAPDRSGNRPVYPTAPTLREILKYVKDVILAAKGYYNAEVAGCFDPDCEVCTSMVSLGDALGGLVRPVGYGGDKQRWRAARDTRLRMVRREPS